jgi:hypothetical protein
MQILIGAGAVALLGGPVLAKDSTKNAMVNPVLPAGGQVFTDCTSKGKISSSGVKLQVKLGKVTAADTDGTHCTNDDYICLVDTTDNIGSARFCSAPSPPNTPCDDTTTCPGGGTCNPPAPANINTVLVLHAEAKGGNISVKHDLCKDSTPPGDPKGSGGACTGSVVPVAAYNTDAVCYMPDPAWTAAHAPGVKLNAPHDCEGIILGQATTTHGGTLPVPANGIVVRQGVSICQ